MTYINRAIEDILKNEFETAKSIAITVARQDSNYVIYYVCGILTKHKTICAIIRGGHFYEIKES